MTTALSSSDLVERNRFFGYVKSSWELANRYAKLLPKDMMPVELIHVSREQLVVDKSHYSSTKNKNSPTNFQIRITGKGFRRIYFGFNILGYKWYPEFKKFFSGALGKSDAMYYFIEIDRKSVVVIFNFEHPFNFNYL